MYKPKETKDIYVESLSINSSNLENQLADKSVQRQEIMAILDLVAKRYHDRVDNIVEECRRDMMALERVPSPLKLFIECLAKARESLVLSAPASTLIEHYVSAWEDWM